MSPILHDLAHTAVSQKLYQAPSPLHAVDVLAHLLHNAHELQQSMHSNTDAQALARLVPPISLISSDTGNA